MKFWAIKRYNKILTVFSQFCLMDIILTCSNAIVYAFQQSVNCVKCIGVNYESKNYLMWQVLPHNEKDHFCHCCVLTNIQNPRKYRHIFFVNITQWIIDVEIFQKKPKKQFPLKIGISALKLKMQSPEYNVHWSLANVSYISHVLDW